MAIRARAVRRVADRLLHYRHWCSVDRRLARSAIASAARVRPSGHAASWMRLTSVASSAGLPRAQAVDRERNALCRDGQHLGPERVKMRRQRLGHSRPPANQPQPLGFLGQLDQRVPLAADREEFLLASKTKLASFEQHVACPAYNRRSTSTIMLVASRIACSVGACRPGWAILSSPSQSASPRRHPNHSALCANSQLLVWESKHAALASRSASKLASDVMRLQMPILAPREFWPVKSRSVVVRWDCGRPLPANNLSSTRKSSIFFTPRCHRELCLDDIGAAATTCLLLAANLFLARAIYAVFATVFSYSCGLC